MSKKEMWDQFYGKAEFQYSQEPIDLLKNYHPYLRKGKALDLAMGEGRNAIFLARQGFHVLGLDISDVAIQKAKKWAYLENVPIEVKAVDVDMYVFPLMRFDTIILSYFKPIPRYYSEIARALVQGGTVAIENYTTEQLVRTPIAGFCNQDYFYPNELLKNLKELQILYYHERFLNGFYIVQCIAKKPVDKDAVKYGFAQEDASSEKSKYKAAEDLFKKK
ncbi:MAG: class I SAM-dependent methyltransferase [Deltaproteobacteria bacterium]|nr:class I SAM-dependent methyltransferase [Deltaproteobacteria bacterium]